MTKRLQVQIQALSWDFYLMENYSTVRMMIINSILRSNANLIQLRKKLPSSYAIEEQMKEVK